MIVRCKMAQCPYYDNRGFCARSEVVGIDQMGMCSVLWRNGRQKNLLKSFSEQIYRKNPITIDEMEGEGAKTS